jgi:6-pyruvoyltetrahydropterin/6-carboxytetrahydropterin synthase
MFSIQVEHTISAAHSLTIAGVREPVHGHNWRVVITLVGSTLDEDGLLCDFHTVHEHLVEVLSRFDNNNFNEVSPFDDDLPKRLNPTAELIAKHVADELQTRIGASLAPHAKIASVSVSEAHRCVATYAPDR